MFEHLLQYLRLDITGSRLSPAFKLKLGRYEIASSNHRCCSGLHSGCKTVPRIHSLPFPLHKRGVFVCTRQTNLQVILIRLNWQGNFLGHCSSAACRTGVARFVLFTAMPSEMPPASGVQLFCTSNSYVVGVTRSLGHRNLKASYLPEVGIPYDNRLMIRLTCNFLIAAAGLNEIGGAAKNTTTTFDSILFCSDCT